MSVQESNDALSVADELLRKALARITRSQADGRAVVDQAYEIAQLVSQALQKHGRNASVISPLLLSAAAEVRETMNNGQAPQWKRVCAGDSRMESHPFFPKTKGFGVAQVSQSINAVAPRLPGVMSVPAIDSVPAEVVKTKTDKVKEPDRGTRRRREEEPGDESKTTTKKRKLAKRISSAIITDTEDEDSPPAGPTIFVKPPKGVVPDVTKEVKKVRLAVTEHRIHRPPGKDKGKKKVVEVKEPELYDPPCAKCSDEHKCVVAYGVRGLPVKACGRCFTLKVKCERPDDDASPTNHVRALRLRSKDVPVSQSKPVSRMTRATSRAHPPTPVVESEDPMDDAEVAVAAHEDVEMSHEADGEQATHIAAVTSTEPEVDQPATVASADNLPANHWEEDPHTIVMLPPSPPYFPSPPPHFTEPTILNAESTVHDRVVALAARVSAMEVADRDVAARVDAMHLDFDTRMSALRAEFSSMKADLDTTVILVDGVLNMVETLQRDRSAPNPSFLPPIADLNVASSVTALGRRYLNSVFNPSVAPSTNSVGVTDTSASRPFGRSDVQGTTFTSGQVTAEPVQAGPSSVSMLDGPSSEPMHAGALSAPSSPPSEAHTFP
ncbi:hypothetical protein BDR04DRAFT_1164258 [Suillus decipiens]|nr:hypothetical protein BDR04DRAFT_1164258 [Suillus decipiens]